MATNEQMRPGWKRSVAATDPAVPTAGAPVRLGGWTGVALTTEDASGKTTVDFGPASFKLSVFDALTTGIAVGDPIYYHDALTGTPAGNLNNDPSGGYAFGIALEVVVANATTTIEVQHDPGLNEGGTADVGSTQLAAGAVTQVKIAPNSLDGTVAKNVANANVIGGLVELFRIDVADASADTDVVTTHKILVLDAWALNTGIAAHATLDTWQLKSTAAVISDAVAKTATVNAVKRVSTMDPANTTIAAGGKIRITAAKNTNAAVTVYVLAVRVA